MNVRHDIWNKIFDLQQIENLTEAEIKTIATEWKQLQQELINILSNRKHPNNANPIEIATHFKLDKAHKEAIKFFIKLKSTFSIASVEELKLINKETLLKLIDNHRNLQETLTNEQFAEEINFLCQYDEIDNIPRGKKLVVRLEQIPIDIAKVYKELSQVLHNLKHFDLEIAGSRIELKKNSKNDDPITKQSKIKENNKNLKAHKTALREKEKQLVQKITQLKEEKMILTHIENLSNVLAKIDRETIKPKKPNVVITFIGKILSGIANAFCNWFGSKPKSPVIKPNEIKIFSGTTLWCGQTVPGGIGAGVPPVTSTAPASTAPVAPTNTSYTEAVSTNILVSSQVSGTKAMPIPGQQDDPEILQNNKMSL